MKSYEILFVLSLVVLIGCKERTQKATEINSPYIETKQVPNTDNIPRYVLGYPHIENIIDSYDHTIKRYANRYGFDWRLILAMMNQESRFQVEAISPVGAYGLMQIMPKTGEEIVSTLYIENVNDPEYNSAGGVYYLRWVYSRFMQDQEEEHSKATEEDRLMLALEPCDLLNAHN